MTGQAWRQWQADTVDEVSGFIGKQVACDLVGRSRATHHRGLQKVWLTLRPHDSEGGVLRGCRTTLRLRTRSIKRHEDLAHRGHTAPPPKYAPCSQNPIAGAGAGVEASGQRAGLSNGPAKWPGGPGPPDMFSSQDEAQGPSKCQRITRFS